MQHSLRQLPLRMALLGMLVLGKCRGVDGQNASATNSLLPNGDFAKANAAGDWPEGWGVRTPGDGVTWESAQDKRFVRLVSQTPGQLQTIYRSLKIVPGQMSGMKVTVRYRTAGVQVGPQPGQDALARVAFEDADGRTLDPVVPPLVFAPSADWREASVQMLVRTDAVRWIFVAGLVHAAAGTVDIGEVDAQPLDAEELAALSAQKPPEPAPPASWVENGDFSKVDAEWPVYWGNPTPGMSWLTETGRHFVRITQETPDQALMLNRTIPLHPGVRGIELLIRWRAEGIEHGEHEWFDARAIVHFVGADGKQVPMPGGDIVFTHKPAPTGWKESVKAYLVPEHAVALQLMTGLYKVRAGTLDVAEVRVTPMQDATVDLQQLTSAAYGRWKGNEDAATDRRIGEQIDAQLAQTGNLVPNGRFERTDKDGKPADWSKPLGDGLSWQVEDGARFVRVTSDDAAKLWLFYRMIPLKLDLKKIEVTIRYRTAGITKGDRTPGDARMVMHYLNGLRFGHLENGKEIAPQPADIELSAGAKNWTEIKRRYAVPEGATKLQLMPGLWYVPPGGVLDIAELRVVPVAD